jgi:uncharacterized protein
LKRCSQVKAARNARKACSKKLPELEQQAEHPDRARSGFVGSQFQEQSERIDNANTVARVNPVDIHYEFNGLSFVWDARKAAANPLRHDGITFEQAVTVFFDPFFRLVDASRNDEARDAALGYDATGRLLFVVHIDLSSEAIRLISARRATNDERRTHEHS